MRYYLFTIFLFVSFLSVAQEVSFPETVTNVKTQEDAKDITQQLAAQLKGKFVFYKVKEFDNGLLRIVYTPEGMTEDEIQAQADYEDSFVADFKAVSDANGKSYRFDKAKAKYDALFPVWKQYFNPNAKPDKKTQRFTNTDKTLLFSFINLGDVWAIGR